MSVTNRTENPVARLAAQLKEYASQIKMALPPNIAVERFQRIVLTAVQQNPDLVDADRRTLLNACVRCAADGLVPDGREAALVIYNTKNRAGSWNKAVQYQPMKDGILKRMRNSGEISGVIANVVRANDEFIWSPDSFDKPVSHRPPKLGTDRGALIGAYALVKLKDGTILHTVLDETDVDQLKKASRSRNREGKLTGPWAEWEARMWEKSALKRVAHLAPMSSEDADFVRRDDEADAMAIEGAAVEVRSDETEHGAGKLAVLEGGLTAQDGADYADRQLAEQLAEAEERQEHIDEDGVVTEDPGPSDPGSLWIARIAAMDLVALNALPTDATYRSELRALPVEAQERIGTAIRDRKAELRAGA